MSDNFFNGYRHPQWQKKRLRIMNRANWRCEHCNTDSKCLNVHHTYYKPAKENAKVWEYDDEDLICLCEDCHENWHVMMNCLKRKLGKLPYFRLREVDNYIDPPPLNLPVTVDGCLDLTAFLKQSQDRFLRAGMHNFDLAWGHILRDDDDKSDDNETPSLF